LLDQLNDRLSIEMRVLAAVLIIGAGTAFPFQLNSGVQGEVQVLQDDQALVVDDLAAMSFEAGSMAEKLAEKEAELESVCADV